VNTITVLVTELLEPCVFSVYHNTCYWTSCTPDGWCRRRGFP